MYKNKIFVIVLSVLLLSASCSVFSPKIIAGISITKDGGVDWQFSNNLKDSKTGSLSTLDVSKMSLDPNNREVVYVSGYNGGLYKSEDSGGTWSKILSNILVYDFVVSPKDSKTIYAGGLFGGHGRLLITKDGGGSWQQIFNEGSSDVAVRSVALNPDNSSQVIIGTSSGNIIRSYDSGLSWKLLKNFEDRVNRIVWQNSSVYVLLREKGLFKSGDSGENFQDLQLKNAQKTQNSLLSLVTPNNYSNGIQAFNQFFVDLVSPNLIYITTSNGLFKTVDEGKSWQFIRLPIKQGEIVARAIAIAKNSSNLVFTSVGSTVYKSTDAGTTWQTQTIATNGFINYILIDPQIPQIGYAGVYGGQ